MPPINRPQARRMTPRELQQLDRMTNRLTRPRPQDNSVEADESSTNVVDVLVEFEQSAMQFAVARPPGYWRMRNGMFLPIQRMENTHLENAIQLVERLQRNRENSEILTELRNEYRARAMRVNRESWGSYDRYPRRPATPDEMIGRLTPEQREIRARQIREHFEREQLRRIRESQMVAQAIVMDVNDMPWGGENSQTQEPETPLPDLPRRIRE